MGEQGMNPGNVVWRDLTVENAEAVRDFYARVAGWRHAPVSMGDYDDFNMQNGVGETVAGICHARGTNAALPAQWLIYIIVPDLDASLAACSQLGGEVVVPPKSSDGTRFAVIRDPAGAVCALYQVAP